MTESGACWSLFETRLTITKQTWDKLTLSNTLDFLFSKFLLGSLRAPILFDRNLLGTFGATNGDALSFGATLIGMDLCGVVAEHIYIA